MNDPIEDVIAAAAAQAEEEVGPEQTPTPPKITFLTPASVRVTKMVDGSGSLEFLITPFEVVAVSLPVEVVQGIVREFTGGIEVAKTMPRMDVPKGRRPQ